jgi:TonB family protein
MSPEQFKGLKQVDNRGDIYSAGMTLYECLAGKLPFGLDDSYYTIAQQVVHGKVPTPETLNLDIPGGLVVIVKKMIACELKDRYQSAEEVVRDLEEFEKSGWAGSGGKGKSAMKGPKVWIAAGVIAILLVAGFMFLRPAGVPSATALSDTPHVKAGGETYPAGQSSKEPASAEKTAPPGETSAAEPSGSGAVAPPASAKKASAPGEAESRAAESTKSPEPAEKVEAPADNGADPPLNLAVDVEPEVISRAEPDYPEVQKRGGVTGDVRLLVLVDREGKVQKVRVQSYDAEAFVNPAVEAARQCVFSPAVMNRVKVRAWAPLKIRFGARQDEGQ